MAKKREAFKPGPIPDKARLFFTDPWDWYAFSEGVWDEYTSCNFMRNKVITPSEKAVMSEMNLTLEDIVNGRYNEDQEFRIDKLFDAWNDRLGYHLYGF